jgi:hypothetical protein
MIEMLTGLLGKLWREQPAKIAAKKTAPAARKRPNDNRDFRAVEIAPSIMCCSAAMQITGRAYLMREAPRLPLYGCTMPTNCACKYRKNADRRDGDRRLFGTTETKRWFGGLDSRKHGGRRLSEK